MPGPGTLDVEIGRVSAVDMLHDLRQVSRRRLKQKVIIVVHPFQAFSGQALAERDWTAEYSDPY
jgi:hypothetical protein